MWHRRCGGPLCGRAQQVRQASGTARPGQVGLGEDAPSLGPQRCPQTLPRSYLSRRARCKQVRKPQKQDVIKKQQGRGEETGASLFPVCAEDPRGAEPASSSPSPLQSVPCTFPSHSLSPQSLQ